METKRVMTGEELKQCFSVRLKVFVEEQKVPADLEIDEFDASLDACHHLLLQGEDGTPVGTGRWRFYTPDTAKLQRIAVLSEYRGIGAGRRVIAALEAWAREEGAAYSLLDAQCQAEAFYAKLGYETISDEPFDDAGIPHVRMRKSLVE
ncbi:GNAT family N-acetyltransferase [Paenibacillus aurantius]|uniref:GNAT family N-acetyltransferase n=1 Tax=Paenibacillus aurantius TaxID=2918900 RepID=A0AA96LHZ1_9BACL|nr:GNAT family N-acetyltransferase [Paenibacillus aurantius]WNQ13560.1 GNAT family N-acetyltransferase [Paenibacillus aurantius]